MSPRGIGHFFTQALACLVADEAPKPNSVKRDPPCNIMPNLYLGSYNTERNQDYLESHGITHVLQAGAELTPTHKASKDLTYHHLPLSDDETQDLLSYLPESFAFINEGIRSGAVLVHCAAGMSRSASVVIAYVMQSQHMHYLEAFRLVKSARHIVCPNIGFRFQLEEFERRGYDCSGWEGWNFKAHVMNLRHKSTASEDSHHVDQRYVSRAPRPEGRQGEGQGAKSVLAVGLADSTGKHLN